MAYSVEIRREAVGILYDIRGAAESVARTVGALGLALPTAGNTFAQGGDLDVYWVGAQRWLLRSHGGRELVAELSALDRDPQVSVVDVTGAYAMFAITGAEANEIMAQATSLDVHWSVFPPIGATFTEFFGQTGLIARRDGGFLVAVEASYADFIEAFLERARG